MLITTNTILQLVIKLDQPIKKQLPLVTMQMAGALAVLQLVVVAMHQIAVRQLVMVQKQVMRDGLQLSVMKQMQVVEVQRLWVMVPHHQERIQLLLVT